jgi:hypothetical protein
MIYRITTEFYAMRCLVVILQIMFSKTWHFRYHDIFGVFKTTLRPKVFIVWLDFA